MTNAMGVIAGQALAASAREKTVVLLAGLFLALVLVSAYLGWSATSTVDAIYRRTVEVLAGQGRPAPPNPVLDTSPLALLRNMATYVSLIGALAAIVMGHRLIALDRGAGTLSLLGTRPLSKADYAGGKILALLIEIGALIVLTGIVNVATFLLLPEFRLDAAGYGRLIGFFALSAIYMASFGLLGLACGALARSQMVGLLVPVTIWLALTFVLPQLTSNVNPVAALNPVTAFADPPQATFFALTGWLLGPVSLAEAYRGVAARLLDFLPPNWVDRAALPPLASLLIAPACLCVLAGVAISRMAMDKADFDA